jgi:hypothetical protein
MLRGNKNMRNYVTELRYEITLRHYVPKLLRGTKNNRNYITLWRIRNQEVKIGVYIVENTLWWLFRQFYSTEITHNYVTFRFRKWLLRVTRNSA